MKKHEAISEMIVDGLIMLLILSPLISTSAIGIFWIYYKLSLQGQEEGKYD